MSLSDCEFVWNLHCFIFSLTFLTENLPCRHWIHPSESFFFFEGPSCVDELSHKEFYWNTKMFFAGLLWKNFHIGWDFYTIYIQYEWSICSPFLSVSKQSRHAHIMYIESVIGRYNCSSSLCWLWRGPLLKRFQCKWWRTGGTTTVTNKMYIMWVFKVVDQWL